MCEYIERNCSAQNGSKTSCKQGAYPCLRGTVPYRAVPKFPCKRSLRLLDSLKHSINLQFILLKITGDTLTITETLMLHFGIYTKHVAVGGTKRQCPPPK